MNESETSALLPRSSDGGPSSSELYGNNRSSRRSNTTTSLLDHHYHNHDQEEDNRFSFSTNYNSDSSTTNRPRRSYGTTQDNNNNDDEEEDEVVVETVVDVDDGNDHGGETDQHPDGQESSRPRHEQQPQEQGDENQAEALLRLLDPLHAAEAAAGITTTATTTTNEHENDTAGNSNGGEEGSETGGEAADESAETRDGTIGILTRRLRCLFSTITWPIVPLGTIVALALLWVLYAASSLDLRKSCSHPLHWYALASLILVAYIPNHATIRSHLFHYSRERDGPIRPARVRMYDQFFHTICLLYVYTGVTLIQTCREDLVNGPDLQKELEDNGNELSMPSDGPMNTCQATCPNLYQALSVYVATLEMFTFALILPLLFLPCIYLWFLRRATAEAEAFAHLQERLQEEEALLNNGGVTVGQILDEMETVKLVSRHRPTNTPPNTFPTESTTGERAINDNDDTPNSDNEEDDIWLLPSSATDASIGMKSDVKECCICMTEFDIRNEADLEDGLLADDQGQAGTSEIGDSDGRDVHTSDSLSYSDESASTVASTVDANCKCDKEGTIVRTKCGHIFHQECLAGWLGGRWQLNPGSSTSSTDDTSFQALRRRRARQTCCPLCREDLRPSTTVRPNTTTGRSSATAQYEV